MAVQLIVHLATEGLQSIQLISNSTDVFVFFSTSLLWRSKHVQLPWLQPGMEGYQLTSRRRQRIIQDFFSELLVAHILSSCET